jgi:hypothetical protein
MSGCPSIRMKSRTGTRSWWGDACRFRRFLDLFVASNCVLLSRIRGMLKFKGIAIVALVLAFLIISIREQVKDSRPILVQAFASADHVELRLLNYGPGITCDAELKSSLMTVLRSLEPTDFPPRQSCSMVHIVARSSTGQEIEVLDLLTTNKDKGLCRMPAEQNYTSAEVPNLLHLMGVKHPELGLRFFNAQGRCE